MKERKNPVHINFQLACVTAVVQTILEKMNHLSVAIEQKEKAKKKKKKTIKANKPRK